MKKLFNYIKTSKLPAKILMGVWAFFIFVVTLGFSVSSDDSTNSSTGEDFLLLLMVYLVTSVMFFIPISTINKISQKISVDEKNISNKSWSSTLLLCLFGGIFGAHRFYVGKTATGIAYLFSAGGFYVGFISDLILILSGKFTDKSGCFIMSSNIHKAKTGVHLHGKALNAFSNITNQDQNTVKTNSAANVSDKQNRIYGQKPVESSTKNKQSIFSDVVVNGGKEITEKIAEIKTAVVPQLTHSVKRSESSETENDDFYTSYSYGNVSKNMAKYENFEGKQAEFVPFMQYWPSYENMDKKQRAWYFYWRTQVRQSIYLDTDLSYIFVHIYELLSGYGWKKPQDGYNQLITLWTNYRKAFPKLDNYLSGWLFDFAQIYNVEYYVPEDIEASLPNQLVIQNLMIDEHINDKPLKLSFELIDALCDYSLIGSKFYKDGHQLLMRESIPRVVALADAALIKKKGKGILELYGPTRATKQIHYAFQSANCANQNRRTEFMLKAYTSNAKLRKYINELVRYAENVLRELYECRGRLRGVELDDSTAVLVKDFLITEYSPKKAPQVEKVKKEVKLDFSNIDKLRTESDTVRNALEVIEDTNEPKELLTDLEPVKEIFSALPPYSRNLMDELKENHWEMKYDSTTQIAIEKINEISAKKLACEILVIESDILILEDDYRDEFEYIYSNIEDFELQIASNEPTNESLFAIGLLSDSMGQFIEVLSPIQEKVLFIVLENNEPKEQIDVIANEEFTMPEILLDEINDLSTQYIGDIIIDTFGDEISVLEQYIEELKKAIKTEE